MSYRGKDVDGLAGCLERGRNQETGTRTALYEARAQGIDSEKYVAVCENHGTILDCYTVKIGRYARAHPLTFCELCRAECQNEEALTVQTLEGSE